MMLPLFFAALINVSAPTRPIQEPDGKAIFVERCQKCHGPAGRPSDMIKKLLKEIPTWDAAFFAARSDSSIIATLKEGKGKNMKSFAEVLKPEEMAAVAKYIRTLRP
jgi:mono/diheme cytochrome c family protein